ncbi:MAG: metalloregulator ArsR/SmtB family transcription factor [Acidobacteriota bacterium]|nr:metalloregulator ArsR/SmtB family transcription factor [Acidobacteriota bacterium]
MRDVSDMLLERIALRFRALGNPVRLRILHTLGDGELSVGDVQVRIGSSQANASKHLAVLRSVDLVTARRDGVNVYYRLRDEAVLSPCETVCDSLHETASDEVVAIRTGRERMLAAR